MTKPIKTPDDERPDFEVAEGPPRQPDVDENLFFQRAEQAAVVDATSGAIDTATILARETPLLGEDEIDRRIDRLTVDVANQSELQALLGQRLANEVRAPRDGSLGLEATESKVASLTETVERLDQQRAASEAVLRGATPAADGRDWREPALPIGRSSRSRFWQKAWVKAGMVPLELFVMIPTFALALDTVLWPAPGSDLLTTAEVASMAVLGAVGVIALPIGIGIALSSAVRSNGRWASGFGLGWLLTPLWLLALGAVGYTRSKPVPESGASESLATAEAASQFQAELAWLIVPLLLAAGAVVVWHTAKTHNPYVDAHIRMSEQLATASDHLARTSQALADITRQVALQDEAITTNRVTFDRMLSDGLPATAEVAKVVYTTSLANAMGDPQVTDGLLARKALADKRDGARSDKVAVETVEAASVSPDGEGR